MVNKSLESRDELINVKKVVMYVKDLGEQD